MIDDLREDTCLHGAQASEMVRRVIRRKQARWETGAPWYSEREIINRKS